MTNQEKIDIINQHIASVVTEEQPKYSNTPDVFVFDKNSFFSDPALNRLNNKYKLVRNNNFLNTILGYTGYLDLSKYYQFFMYGGFINGKKISILLNKDTFTRNFNEQLYLKILTTFHEFRHIGQMEKFDIKNIEKPITDFNYFRYLIENYCRHYLAASYTFAHDDFYFEIDANLYSIDRADEYCKKNNIFTPDFRQKTMQRHYSKMLTYNFDNFIFLQKLNPRLPVKLSKNPTYNLFFNKNGTFKNLSDIITNPLFNSLDDTLIMEMLTSNSFLSSINYNLNDMEINFLIKNIDNKISELVINYNKNRIFYEQNIFDYNSFIKNSSSLLSNMSYLLDFKIKHTRLNDNNKDMFFTNIKQQIHYIRNACSLNNSNGLEYSDKEIMNNQLNDIISILNNFFNNNNNLNNTQVFSSIVKMLQDAILAKVDISSVAVNASYEQIVDDYQSNLASVQNSGIEPSLERQHNVPNKNFLRENQTPNNNIDSSFAFSPETTFEIPQIDNSKVRKKVKGNISYQLLFFVNIILSILITTVLLFIIYK